MVLTSSIDEKIVLLRAKGVWMMLHSQKGSGFGEPQVMFPLLFTPSAASSYDGLDCLLLLITMSIYSILGVRLTSALGTVREAATW